MSDANAGESRAAADERALAHLAAAEREVRHVPGLSPAAPARSIARAGIVGAGTMGAGIAMAYANAGIPVVLSDIDSASLARGLRVIEKHYQSAVEKGRLSDGERQQRLARITTSGDLAALADADIVTEAVFEDLALKQGLLVHLAEITRAHCLLATNTSSLDVDELARASGSPQRVVGHHFFSPAQVMKLLEIVRGRETSDEVLATSLALAKQLGKVGVVVGNCLGFVGNRLLAYYMREAYLLLEEGASPAQIDAALTGFGMAMGPFAMQDVAGIDVGWRIRQYLASLGKTRAEGPQSAVPDRLYELGRYGQKTGAGWYRYESGSRTPIPDPLVDEIAATEVSRRGVSRRAIGDEEIVARVMTALINEGARVLGEGHASRAGDVDVIYVYGYGFPRQRGGPLFYADTIGVPTVLARVTEYRERFGDYWRPAPLLEELASRGQQLHTWQARGAGV